MVATRVGTSFAWGNLAWDLHGWTSVWTYVGPLELHHELTKLARVLLRELFITRAHATNIQHG